MRRLSILFIAILVAFSFAAIPLIADGHSCDKAAKSCCVKDAACCKTADAACCKDSAACCDDAGCCTTSADGKHVCSMTHKDGSACASATCCKSKSCKMEKKS